MLTAWKTSKKKLLHKGEEENKSDLLNALSVLHPQDFSQVTLQRFSLSRFLIFKALWCRHISLVLSTCTISLCLHVSRFLQKLNVKLNLERALCNRLFKTVPESMYVITSPPPPHTHMLADPSSSITPPVHFVQFWHWNVGQGFPLCVSPKLTLCGLM